MSFELRVVQEFLLTSIDRADEHTLTMSHLMLSEGAMVRKLLKAVLDVALVDTLTGLQIVQVQLVL